MLLFYIICTIVTVALTVFTLWYQLKHSMYESLTLEDCVFSAFLTLCPIVQIFMCLYCIAFIFSDVLPNIVVFKGKGKDPE